MTSPSTVLNQWPPEFLIAQTCCLACTFGSGLLLRVHNRWSGTLGPWRTKVCRTGLILIVVLSLAEQVLLTWWAHVLRVSTACCSVDREIQIGAGLMMASLLPLVLVSFGKGRLRWLGLLCAVLLFYGITVAMADVD